MRETVVGPEDEFHELAEETPAALSETHHPRDTQHLRTGFYAQPGPSAGVGDLLPYHQLGGPGLERLCYLLLLDEGKVPRYFGKPGQEQYGIDLLVTEGDGTTVYQCKNEKDFPPGKMEEALRKFEAEWLGRPELPRPTKFVLCCPLPLQELKQNVAWTTRERGFHDTTGVSVTFWDRHYLDERLRRLPDVVADLFSDETAIQFCGVRDWNYDLFRPLVTGSGERMIERYLEIRDGGRLYVDPKREKNFSRKLERSDSLLIRGLPGTGKTVTGLALAESLRHRQGPYRIFYVNLRHDLDEDTLVKGVRRRLTRPTVFFLDDCHGNFELLDRVHSRLRPILAQRPGPGLLVFATRTTPTPEGILRGDFSDFENRLAEEGSILEFRPTPRLFRHITTLAKPHFAGLSEARLGKVFEFTGHDLFLLDQLFETLESPQGIDRLSPEGLFENTLTRYFGAPAVYRPGFLKLAALAQFDLAPPVASFGFDLEQEDERATSQLVATAGHPLRYHFLHSSAAELVFRALAWNDGVDDHPALAAGYLTAFFKSRPASDKRLVQDLENVIHNRLRLKRDDAEGNRLKSRFLADDGIYALIESVFERLLLSSLAVCLIILQDTDDATFERYHDLVQRKVDDGSVLRMAIERPFWESSLLLQLVKSAYPAFLSGLRRQLVDRGLRSLIETTEFQNALALLASLSAPDDPWWVNSLDSVPTNEFAEMIRRTIASGRSIGTINFALRDLKKTDPVLLAKLEHKIGAERYLRLIAGAGTIFELLMIIRHSSLSMAGELIDALDAETLDALVAQTIASGRSIGTIDFALRGLKKTDRALLEKLESKIGAERYLHLIAGTGTISDLFKIVEHSSLSMASELIEALDAETLDALIAQTIASGRSIGTIHLALRQLKKTDSVLSAKLESKIGAERYLRLIASAGTIFELLMVIRHSSLSMVGELIEALDAETLDGLVVQTIASGRSIGTINFALRDLEKTDPALLAKLERKIGAERYLRLIVGAGTIFELLMVIRHSSLSMAGELIEVLDAKTVDALIAQTIASGRSIGTINLALRELKKTDWALLGKLERKIGAQRWWRLICANGTMRILRNILRYMDGSFQQEMVHGVQSLSLAEWQALLLRGDFADLCYFVRRASLFFSAQLAAPFLDSLRPTFETLIRRGGWQTLEKGAGLLRAAPESLIKQDLLDILDDYVATVTPGSLRFDSFGEATACVSLVWHEAPSQRQELIDSLLMILPEEDVWYASEEFLRSARLLFFILADPRARQDDARRVLSIGNDEAVAPLCNKARTLDLVFYLWDLHSLWLQWGKEGEETFADFLHPGISNAITDVLARRIQGEMDEDERDSLVILAGFLSFSGLAPALNRAAIADWVATLPPFSELQERALSKTFIPAVLFLFGLERVFDREGGVPARTWQQVLPKAEAYSEKRSSLERLCDLVRARARV